MNKKKIFALGFFDGVHLGHQALLSACCQLAQLLEYVPAAVTLTLSPSAALQNTKPNMLTTALDRERLLQRYGMKSILLLNTDTETLSMSWQAFLEMLVDEGAAGFVCGYDYRFGRSGEGTAEKLAAWAAERNFPCIIVPEQVMDGEKISSTRIRALIEKGDIENANRLLGHPHMFTGTVVAGQQLGRTIGIPTANLHLPDTLLTPAFGVYACTAFVDGYVLTAVTNIGIRPTVNGEGITVESWLPGFRGNLYGKELTLEFHKFLRPERKFNSLEELKAQIQIDAAESCKILR